MRSKNILSVLAQTLVIFSLIIVLWSIYGYSIAFTEGEGHSLGALIDYSWQALLQIQLQQHSVKV